MIRLQRVTFLTLHDYLGLTTELTRSNNDISQVQTTHHTHDNHHRRRRIHTHSNLLPDIPSASIDALNSPDDDVVNNENFRASRLTSTMSCTSPSSDQSELTTPTPNQTNNKNQFEGLPPPSTTERTISAPISIQKRSSAFSNHRSMSVVESRHMKPDFEEAAARARVKNSIDTTFFQKHKISYPNVLNKRLSSTSATRRRSSFSDVKLRFFVFFLSKIFYSYFLLA
jgi:hypothetical protein